MKTVVIGAGAMGLAAAHYALNLGHEVDLVEADAVPGGMAAHFDFGGLSIERLYHFVCKPDAPTFALMAELGIADKMRWRPTSMAYFAGGALHKWGDPISLLTTSLLNPLEKLRYGLQMFLTTRRRSFDGLERVSAKNWIENGSGKGVYDKLWRRLMELKFYQYAGQCFHRHGLQRAFVAWGSLANPCSRRNSATSKADLRRSWTRWCAPSKAEAGAFIFPHQLRKWIRRMGNCAA